MDEFSKLYEGEKGVSGILLILLCMMLTVEPIFGIISASIWDGVFSGSDVLKTISICLSVIYILFSLISGMALLKVSRHALFLLKACLIFRLPFFLLTVIANMMIQINAIPYEKNFAEYSVKYNSIITSFVVNVLYIAVFSIGWYIYLVKSKKVQECLPLKDSSTMRQA